MSFATTALQHPWMPVGAGFAGLGAAEGASGLLDFLDMPRRGLWSMLGLPETGTGLLQQAGMDPESPWTKALGFGTEALLDPLNLLAGLGAARGAGKAGQAAKYAGGLKKAMAGFEGEAKALAEMRSLAEAARAGAGVHPLSARGLNYARDLERVKPWLTYPEAAVKALPPTWEGLAQAAQAPRTYGRFAPEVAAAVENLGVGKMGPGGLQVFNPRPPEFLAGRGGKMFLREGASVPDLGTLGGWDMAAAAPEDSRLLFNRLVGEGSRAPSSLADLMPMVDRKRLMGMAPEAVSPLSSSLLGGPSGLSQHMVDWHPSDALAGLPSMEGRTQMAQQRLAEAMAQMSPLEQFLHGWMR